ncbi:MAG: alpha/beta family hydrolase [Pseudomonadota bacterium]
MDDTVEEVRIPPLDLQGLLGVPPGATGLVIFAHGSGSGRLSPRNQRVAAALRAGGLGTLLFDLLTEEEERDRRNVFDIELLASRVEHAIRWATYDQRTAHLPLGLFGASTGAGAALAAASRPHTTVAAIVSRGGRPDLAGPDLAHVSAPTLLIVGGHDEPVIEMNRNAMAVMHHATVQLEIVPGATHLFEEPGTLDEVIRLATGWFQQHFRHDPVRPL